MRKPVTVGAFVVFVVLLAGCSTLNTLGALLGSQVTFTQPQLQHALDGNFPKQYERLGGLVSLRLTNPTLSIPYDSSRLRLDFDVGLSAMGSSVGTTGHFALSSGLRFDPQTRGLHLQDPVLESVDVPALGGVMSGTSRELLNTWLADYARDEPVYRLESTLLDRISARRIDSTVIDRGVVVVNLGE
ncbi:DUF1439 domain-containing protein [Lysobacter zhanggongensis]|uniref:DUF1439 domain-containing protein n=1 Tax=Lysobacter zhanggongensis TaxID=1774951 RepID=A0ABU7YSP7_9GAMM